MSKVICIAGESGSGKTTSMRNLDPKTTYYIDCDKKGLSWKGWRKQYCEANKNYFQTDFENTIAQEKQDVPLLFETRRNLWADMLTTILPFALIIGVWILIMRSMSRNGGGANGGIFNVGKAKAQVFDKDSMVKTTFKEKLAEKGIVFCSIS